MGGLATVLIAIVALLHAGFLVLEMFLWKAPAGRRIFGTTAEFAERSASLAANQGLYNGFLAAGLVWSIVSSREDVATFLLACIIIAGVYGAVSVKRSILFVQALPAALALGSLFLD